MHTLLGVSFSYVLIDVLLALVAFTIGFCLAIWYSHHARSSTLQSGTNGRNVREQEEADNQAERANMAVMQMRDLAKNVASDVGTHNTIVTGISERLGLLDEDSLNTTIVTEAVGEIVSANSKLQARLADAEKKIQSQAEELRLQQSEARTDSLTKLANRREFDDSLEKQIQQYRRTRRPFSLLLFDVDHFKEFNDAHGHLAGDEVLRHVAKAFKKSAKSTDQPCRYGGEEFALIMPSTHIAQARHAAERIRKEIEKLAVKCEGKMLSVTASMGVAEFATEEDATKIIRRSDDCVYAAKKAGRNCTFWHDGKQCLPEDAAPGEQAIETVASGNGMGQTAKNVRTYHDLPTKNVFQAELQRRISESHRFGVSLTLMYLHVAGYSKLTQEFGSAVSDLILDSVTQFIGSTLRDMDLLGKLEPGEFIVMLPGSNAKEANLVGTRVQTAISNCTIPTENRRVPLVVKQSVTEVQPHDDAESLIKRSKQLLIDEVREAISVN